MVCESSVDVLDALHFHLNSKIFPFASYLLICQVLNLPSQLLAFNGRWNQWKNVLKFEAKLRVVRIQADAYVRVTILYEHDAFEFIVLLVVLQPLHAYGQDTAAI